MWFGGRRRRMIRNDADIRIKPSLAVVLYLPQTVEERLRQRHLFTLAACICACDQ